MSGETEANISGWTTDTLHSHVVKLLDERSKEFDARFESQERALELARDADLRRQAAMVAITETRFDAMDKAGQLLYENLTRVPTDVDKQVGHLKSLHDERFKSIETQLVGLAESMVVRFQERDTRSEREARDNKIAVDAAFAAAKEAVAENNKSSALATDKSEASFTKQIDQLTLLIESRAKASDDKIDDLKQQVVDIRTGASNSLGHRQGGVDARTLLLTVLGLVLSFVVVMIAAAAAIAPHLH